MISTRQKFVWLVKVFLLLVVFTPTVKPKPPRPVKIRVWDANVHDKEYTTSMFKKFNEEHKNIHIEYTSMVTASYGQVVNLAFLAGELPDIFAPTPSILKLLELRAIMPFDHCAPSRTELKAWMNRFPAGLHAFEEGENVFDGKVYSFNLRGAIYRGLPLFYNKVLFQEAGIVDENGEPTPPRTWSELRKYAKIITEKGRGKYYGIIMFGKPSHYGWGTSIGSLVTAAGGRGDIDFRVGRYNYQNDAWRGVVKLWCDMYKDGSVFPGSFNITDEVAKMQFALNRAAMQFGGWWNPAGYLAYNPNCDFDVILPPTPDDGVRRGYPRRPEASGDSYVVSSLCKHPWAAWEVIKFITSREYQEGYVKGGYGLSIYPELNKPEYLKVPCMAKLAEWAWTQSRIEPDYPKKEWKRLGEIMEPVQPAGASFVEGIVLGIVDLEEGLHQQEEKMNAALDRALERAKEEGINITREDLTFPDWDPAKDYVPKRRKGDF